MSTPTIDTATTSAPPELRTDTEKALWAALNSNPGSTAAELARTAEIGASTARKTLARWVADHHVHREPKSDPRSADTWSATSCPADSDTRIDQPEPTTETVDPGNEGETRTEQAAADTAGAAQKPEGSEPTVVDNGEAKPDKLPPGGLRGQVEDYLRDHPGESFTPHQIGKALERSCGAVHNALVKLAATGVADQTNDAPKKFALKP
ncbi:hypothetical protein [Nocardia cyriacigeorgica]|uniref:Uncharacterized protein n=2 Tax=Nocardia cyriacigeorgica TaxID=135487 RepID=H6R745_NOCCG|nr:hypothetical protein [Nocardia cyriacigeorgica]MBF6424024.1 hypothetical protein [Nocardia cyriacigeorgica]TLF56669.1 hypothetical protein FEK31_15580 [Nocardia cyriacigeorgica]TLF97867.1 hypothetical protein FEK35_26280 [Nocardia cyriacigeorgica]CCF64764.1 protein of unknown function; putative ''Winged helix'' DNA-binding domain [Nocardia cyriacigeorgica GUH-2]VFA98925.1 Uncharacterised protein [Nocardia cyriacigeorgica]